jgi:hypothetical protein
MKQQFIKAPAPPMAPKMPAAPKVPMSPDANHASLARQFEKADNSVHPNTHGGGMKKGGY